MQAQETTTYRYDAQGHLVGAARAAAAGSGSVTNYSFDAAHHRAGAAERRELRDFQLLHADLIHRHLLPLPLSGQGRRDA